MKNFQHEIIWLFMKKNCQLDQRFFLLHMLGKYYVRARYFVHKVAFYPFNDFACVKYDCRTEWTIKNTKI